MTVFGKATERRFPKPTFNDSPGPAYGLPSTLSKRGAKVRKDIIDDGQRIIQEPNGNKIYKSNREAWIGGAKSNGGLAYAGKKDLVSPGPIYKPKVNLVKQRAPTNAQAGEKRFLRAKARYMGRAHENSMKHSETTAPGPGTYSDRDPTKPRVRGKQFAAGAGQRPPSARSSLQRGQHLPESRLSTQDDRDAWIRGVATNGGNYALKDVADTIGPALLSMGMGDKILEMTKPHHGGTRIPVKQEKRESKRFGAYHAYIDKDHEIPQKGQDSPGPIYHPSPPPVAGGTLSIARHDRAKQEKDMDAIRAFRNQFGEETMNKRERYYQFVSCPDTPGPGNYNIRTSPVPSTHHKGDFAPPESEEARYKNDLRKPRGLSIRRTVVEPKVKSDGPNRPEYSRPQTGRSSPFGFEDAVGITDQLGPNISPRAFPDRPSSASAFNKFHRRLRLLSGSETTGSQVSGGARNRRHSYSIGKGGTLSIHRPKSAHAAHRPQRSRAQSTEGHDMAYIRRNRPMNQSDTPGYHQSKDFNYVQAGPIEQPTGLPFTPIPPRQLEEAR